MPTQIKRDPFGRRSLMRERINTVRCYNCGSKGKFRYQWVNDAGREPSWRNVLPFCGVQCFRSYYCE
jgi:hypothetical protein